jgi:hypothetical protein
LIMSSKSQFLLTVLGDFEKHMRSRSGPLCLESAAVTQVVCLLWKTTSAWRNSWKWEHSPWGLKVAAGQAEQASLTFVERDILKGTASSFLSSWLTASSDARDLKRPLSRHWETGSRPPSLFFFSRF